MARRVHISAGRAVISLPGFDAPSPPVHGVAFDSSWPFTALVLSRGSYTDPSPMVDGRPNMTSDTRYFVPVQRVRPGYSHYIVLFFERNGARVTRQLTMRGDLHDANTLAIQRKYFEIPGRQNEVLARGWQRFRDPVGFMVIAG